MMPNKNCPINNICMKLSEIIRTQSENQEAFKINVCGNYFACPEYQKVLGVKEAIMGAVSSYNKRKQNIEPSIRTENKNDN